MLEKLFKNLFEEKQWTEEEKTKSVEYSIRSVYICILAMLVFVIAALAFYFFSNSQDQQKELIMYDDSLAPEYNKGETITFESVAKNEKLTQGEVIVYKTEEKGLEVYKVAKLLAVPHDVITVSDYYIETKDARVNRTTDDTATVTGTYELQRGCYLIQPDEDIKITRSFDYLIGNSTALGMPCLKLDQLYKIVKENK